jgi:hypothetical protein
VTTFLEENVLVLPEFLKNKYFVKGKFSKNVGIPESKYFFNEKSPSYILVPESGEFLKNKIFINGKSPSFVQILEK